MKYLIIENGCGYYCLDGCNTSKKSLDKITKEDLLTLVELCVEEEDFEMDTYDSSLVKNAAHQIIYKNIFQKLEDIIQRRVSFADEKNSLYRKAIEKYSSEIDEQNTDNE
ncbi:MAG: hypothetical protein PUB87_00630 [Eubacteriaceae bacterium]|nr:hypothetical protein [Eubacteriaceae bacterium]